MIGKPLAFVSAGLNLPIWFPLTLIIALFDYWKLSLDRRAFDLCSVLYRDSIIFPAAREPKSVIPSTVCAVLEYTPTTEILDDSRALLTSALLIDLVIGVSFTLFYGTFKLTAFWNGISALQYSLFAAFLFPLSLSNLPKINVLHVSKVSIDLFPMLNSTSLEKDLALSFRLFQFILYVHIISHLLLITTASTIS